MGKTRGHRGSQHTYKKHQPSKASLKWAKVDVHREARAAMRSDLAHADRVNGPEDTPDQRSLVSGHSCYRSRQPLHFESTAILVATVEMLLWRRPDDTYFRNLLTEQRDKPFSYPKVQATYGKKDKAACQELVTDGYDVDHYRVKLGDGEECFTNAVRAMREWRMHRFSNWVEVLFPDVPLQVGETIGVLASHTACYSFSICKIVYTVDEQDEDGQVRRFGFAYGTLETHVETGEERFLIEWNRADNSVYYDLMAFSRPSTWWVRMGYPLARRYQASFAKDSAAAMRAAVSQRV